jgi:16S rRNA (uracil1498-N3)-methyltransferase
MSSFIIEPVDAASNHACITGEEARHATRVLRVTPGDVVKLTDGVGMSYSAEVQEVTPRSVDCTITERSPESGEPLISVTLAAGLLKSDRFEMLVEKATELGVSEIWPMISTNNVVRDPSPNKRRRWDASARSATKQCLRSRIPTISNPMSLDDVALRVSEFTASFVAWERQSESVDTTIPSGARILVIVGPEGGLEASEISRLESAGVVPITLGVRRLRGETAGIAAVTLMLERAGEYSREAYGAG